MIGCAAPGHGAWGAQPPSCSGLFGGDSGGAYPAAAGWHMTVVRGLQMCNLNEWIVREAFLAYDRGDVAAMMDFVDPGLE